MTLAVETMISLAVTRVKRSSSNTPNAELRTMGTFTAVTTFSKGEVKMDIFMRLRLSVSR